LRVFGILHQYNIRVQKKVCRSIADIEIERHKMNEAGKLFQVLYVYYTASA
jgi:hypothetical protein